MKRLLFALVILSLCIVPVIHATPAAEISAPSAPLACAEVFLSEYVEPNGGNNKAIEVYNGTGVAVDLSGGGYKIEKYTNGATSPTSTINLTGTALASGDVWVLANSAHVLPPGVVDQTSGVLDFNGNDVIVLKKGTAIIDSIGQIGNSADFAKDTTLRRKSTISAGDTTPSDAWTNAEWDVYAANTFDGLGAHTASCSGGADVPPVVSTVVPADGATDVALAANLTISFSEPVTVAGDWFQIACSASGTRTVSATAVTGGPASYTVNPNADFVTGETCQVTVYAAQVTDQDGAPDGMAANFGSSFSTVGLDPCAGAAALIHDIQGAGTASPVAGQSRTIQGVVVGDFEVNGLRGYFVQEEDAQADANPLTAEGIFVYDNNGTSEVSAGEIVRVTGTVVEFSDRTVGSGTLTELSSPVNLLKCGAGSVTPVSVTLPEVVNGDLERYEGMLVSIAGSLTVSQDYFVGRYGQMTLSAGGRMYQPTNQFLPGSAEAVALAAENARRTLILDDGMALNRCGDNPDPAPYLGTGPAVIRAGDSVSGLVGVLDYGQIDSGETGGCSTAGTLFTGDYRLHPTQAPVFAATNPRPTTSPAGSGNVKVTSANTLNFFNGDGNKGGFPTSRGASTFTEFVRQRIKLYEGLSKLNADVVGLAEIENDGFGSTSAIAEMVKVLNLGPCWNSAAECTALGYTSSGLGAGVYAFINPGISPVGADEITVGILYKPSKVTPVGATRVLTDVGFTDPRSSGTQKSRPAIVQTFQENTWGERFTVVANHLKSKGSECNTATNTNDDDMTTGQGNCNGTRTDGAAYQVTWLATDPTGTGDPDFLVIGDMNAYAKEDPITQYLNAGYTDLANAFGGSAAYSYIFDGQSGYLDHALASSTLTTQVVSASDWHINADEPAVIDYNTEFNPAGYYAPNQYRAADHDPVLITLGLCPAAAVPSGVGIAINAAVNGVDLTWAAAQNAASYQIWRRTTPYFTPNRFMDAPLNTDTASPYPDGNVLNEPNISYYYQVAAVSACGLPSSLIGLHTVGKFEFGLVRGQ